LSALPDLQFLAFMSLRLENRHLAHLKSLSRLREFAMPDVRNITAEGLTLVAEVEQLERLILRRTNLDDKGLIILAGMKNLKRLDVTETQVTAAGVTAFQEKLPDCEVVWDEP
jgi:hypothetical protein